MRITASPTVSASRRHCGFRNDDGMPGFRQVVILFDIVGGDDVFLGHQGRFGCSFLAMVIAQAPLVTPKLLGDPFRCNVEGGIGIARLPAPMHLYVAADMDRNIGADHAALALRRDHHGGIDRVVEIFLDGFREPGLNMTAERFADVYLFSRNRNLHQKNFFSAAVSGTSAGPEIPGPTAMGRERRRNLGLGTGSVNHPVWHPVWHLLFPFPDRLSAQGMRHLSRQGDWRRHICSAFSRRLWTDEGICMDSRYLATVRRATSTPASRKIETSLSSDRTLSIDSESISALIR